MYCRKCGKEIKDDNVFCEYCGNKTSGSDFYDTPDQALDAKRIARSKRKKAKICKIIFLCSLAIYAIIILALYFMDFPIWPTIIFCTLMFPTLFTGIAWLGYSFDIPESERTVREEKSLTAISFIKDLFEFFKD